MRDNNLPVYDKEKCTFFALGRNAMYAACKALGLKEGDEILTPAFDCDGSLQPFRVLGYKLRFFRSDAHNFSVYIDDIKRKITPETKLIHIINHFGMPQPWSELLALREETGIPILEDNAYSLFSKLNGEPFGTFGDMAIFSLRKNLPLVDGGMLRVNNPRYVFKLDCKKARCLYPTEWTKFLGIIKRKLEYVIPSGILKRIALGIDPLINAPPPLYSDPKKGYPAWPFRDQIGKDFSYDYLRPMSGLARYGLSRFSQDDYNDIIDKKRRYYILAAEKLQNIKGLAILRPVIHVGIVPFCLSFLVESKRDIFLETLRKKYEVMAWPTFPDAVLDQMKNFPEVEILGRKLLQFNLPVDKIRMPNFPKYLENAVRDIRNLSHKYL